MMPSNNTPLYDIRALRWGDRASMYLQDNWVGWVQQSNEEELVLVDNDTNVVRIVTPTSDDGPLNLVVPHLNGLTQLSEGHYVWCVHRTLWFDTIAVRLPESAPWNSGLMWQTPLNEGTRARTSRHLALLADWVMARAPEGTLGALVPELLVAGAVSRRVGKRTDLPVPSRLLLVQAADTLAQLLPALTEGDMATVETFTAQLVGLGDGILPVGTAFVIGLVAGIRFWSPFLDDGSGLHVEGVVHRLTRGYSLHTTFLGDALLRAANEHAWEGRWHTLHMALNAAPRHHEEQRNYLRMIASSWMDAAPALGSASLSGLLLPYLWHQHHIRAIE